MAKKQSTAKKKLIGLSQHAFHHTLKPRNSNKTKSTNRQQPKKRKK
jgi:hypothetical protein